MNHEPQLSGSKRCAACGETKPTIAFAVSKQRADGLRAACRECLSAANKRAWQATRNPNNAKVRRAESRARMKQGVW